MLVASSALPMLMMESEGMFPIIDVSTWERLNTEQMGTKPKFWCLDQSGVQFLFKESRHHAGENWSEKVAAEIAQALGIPHAEIELAVCDGNNGTISRKFQSTDEPSSLIHGNELLYEHDPDYPVEAPNFRLAQHTLDRIFRGLARAGARLPDGFIPPQNVTSACELFSGYLMLDALIVNTDRHHANWGVISFPDLDGSLLFEIAPTFDHASSLGRELTDNRRTERVRDEQRRHDPKSKVPKTHTVVGYLVKDEGRSRIYATEENAKPMHPMEAFRMARERFPDAAEAWIDRLSSIEMAQFSQIISHVPTTIMSQPARDFGLCLLELNRTALITRTFQYA